MLSIWKFMCPYKHLKKLIFRKLATKKGKLHFYILHQDIKPPALTKTTADISEYRLCIF